MTGKDAKRFARVMAALGETFNETISDVRSDAYFGALQEFPIEAVEQAATNHIRVGRFFPRPVELREWIQGTVEDRANTAWRELQEEFRRVGSWWPPKLSPFTEQAMLALCGSWERACALIGRADAGPELQGWRKRFQETCHVLATREQALIDSASPPVLSGATAAATGISSDSGTHMPVPVVDTTKASEPPG